MRKIKEIQELELWKARSNPLASFFNQEKICLDQIDTNMIVFTCNSYNLGTFTSKTNFKKLKKFIEWIAKNFEFDNDYFSIYADIYFFELEYNNIYKKWNIKTSLFY